MRPTSIKRNFKSANEISSTLTNKNSCWKLNEKNKKIKNLNKKSLNNKYNKSKKPQSSLKK